MLNNKSAGSSLLRADIAKYCSTAKWKKWKMKKMKNLKNEKIPLETYRNSPILHVVKSDFQKTVENGHMFRETFGIQNSE